MVHAIAPRWTPSLIMPPSVSARSACSASVNKVQARCRSARALTQARTTRERWNRGWCGRCRSRLWPGWCRGEWVAESIEDVAEFLGGQQVEQHEHVGRFRQPVVVGAIAFSGQNEIEAADVGVLGAIGVHLELGQLLVPGRPTAFAGRKTSSAAGS
jgi:hypothetical protein